MQQVLVSTLCFHSLNARTKHHCEFFSYDCVGIPPPVSFHQCAILISCSFTIADLSSYTLIALLNNTHLSFSKSIKYIRRVNIFCHIYLLRSVPCNRSTASSKPISPQGVIQCFLFQFQVSSRFFKVIH